MAKKKYNLSAINVQLSNGEWLRMRPVSVFLQQDLERAIKEEWIEAHGSLPTPPTYSITTVAGDVETHILDRKAAEEEPDETKRAALLAALDKYEEDKSALKRLTNERRIDMAVYESAEVVDFAGMEAWEKRMARYGMKPPTDPVERKAAYIKQALLTRPEDWITIVTAMTSASTLSKEKLVEAQASFRGDVEADTAGDADAEAPEEPVAGSSGEHQDAPDSSAGLGENPERVLQPQP